jgi:nucleoside-diphosphate-sugar epimerase
VRRPDITPARAALRWEPRVDFEKGLLSTIAWFQHESVPVPASS